MCSRPAGHVCRGSLYNAALIWRASVEVDDDGLATTLAPDTRPGQDQLAKGSVTGGMALPCSTVSKRFSMWQGSIPVAVWQISDVTVVGNRGYGLCSFLSPMLNMEAGAVDGRSCFLVGGHSGSFLRGSVYGAPSHRRARASCMSAVSFPPVTAAIAAAAAAPSPRRPFLQPQAAGRQGRYAKGRVHGSRLVRLCERLAQERVGARAGVGIHRGEVFLPRPP